eukprot:superscaffoldBa00002705_g15055
MAPMAQDDDIDFGQECVIKALCVYLSEDPANLVREFRIDVESFLRSLTLHPSLEPVCLDPYSLQNALNIYQADHGPLDIKERAA